MEFRPTTLSASWDKDCCDDKLNRTARVGIGGGTPYTVECNPLHILQCCGLYHEYNSQMHYNQSGFNRQSELQTHLEFERLAINPQGRHAQGSRLGHDTNQPNPTNLYS